MDIVVFLVACGFTLVFALLGLKYDSIFAIIGGLAGLLVGISVTVDNTIEVAHSYTGATWVSHTVPAYPITWILVLLTMSNWIVMFMRMKSR